MTRFLNRDTIQKIREEILRGKSKYQVAKEMKVAYLQHLFLLQALQ